MVKNLPANAEDTGSTPGKIPWRSKWQPTPVFMPGKSHGQKSLEGYRPQSQIRLSDKTPPPPGNTVAYF